MEKQNKRVALIGLVVVIFFLVSLAVLLILPEKQKPINPFKDCKVLVDSCKDKSCNYLYLCNETEFSDCKVYDCGEKYGMSVLDKQGNIQNKFRQKPDQEKVQEMIVKCCGSSFEIIEKNNCENGEAKVRIKLDTQSDCKIISATMAVNGKIRIAGVKQDGEFYNISVKSCGEISDIKVTGEGGVGIREKIEISEDNLPEDMMNQRSPEGFPEELSEEELLKAEM